MDSDGDLLKRYVFEGSDEAFRELVNRYAGIVLACARRRIGDHGLAEDATQKVFVLLAGRAKSLVNHPAISGWLHTTTGYVCAACVRSERRRTRKHSVLMSHQQVSEASADAVIGGKTLDDRTPLLDEALDRLSQNDRQVVLLRFAEELSYGEIGTRLGKSESACRKQVSRALGKLAAMLRRKGVMASSASIAVALTMQIEKSVASQTFVASVARAALAADSALPPSIVITNIIKTMAYGKTKMAIAVALVAAIPIGIQWHQSRKSGRQVQEPENISVQRRSLLPEESAPMEETIVAAPVYDNESSESPTRDSTENEPLQLPTTAEEVDSFRRAPLREQARLLALFRTRRAGISGAGKSLEINETIKESLRPQLEELESDPAAFAEFQAAFIAEIIGSHDEEKLQGIEEIIRNTYDVAVANGLDSPSRPESDVDRWAEERDALDRPATRAIQDLLSPSERSAFDQSFIGVMGIDLGQGDGVWNRFTNAEGDVVFFPSEMEDDPHESPSAQDHGGAP